MKQFATVLLAAVLIQPAMSAATDKSTDTRPKPSSFVPHPHTNSHVYGSPIQPAIVSHSKSSHHKHTPKKPSATPKQQG